MEKILTLLLLFLLNIFIWIVDCCYPGIEGIGTVSPLGDISHEIGSDIVINCTLNNDYNGPATASDIRWRRNGTDIPKQFITVLNNKTAQLHLINTSMEDSGYYSCYVDARPQSTVCNNDVKIGKPPPSEVNITCLARNWKNLTCSWSAPFNPVHTNWSFFYRLYKYRLECPEYLNARTGCFFSEKTNPPYRPAAKEYYFYLEGENPLGKNKINFIFDHYQDVLPNSPSGLTLLEMNSRQLQVKWSAPSGMELFPPQLFYQLEYFSDWQSEWTIHNVGLNVTSFVLANLIPNTNYTVQVLCRSGASESSPWSRPSVQWKKTLADVPGAAPRLITGSFQQKTMITKRDIYLHWQAIPEILENGDDFSYAIDALEDGLQRELVIQEQSQTSALIVNLELEKMYVFRLRAKNEKGLSRNISSLTVYPAHKLPPRPDHINIIAFEQGVYEASWPLAEENDNVDNFTLFWCETRSNRPGQHCYDSDIMWQIVNSNVTAVNLSLSNEKNYQFALAVNSGLYSSGMVWATCVVSHDGVIGKLKSVSVLHNRIHEIELSWRLDCSDRSIATGFNVYYCMYNETTKKCRGNQTQHYPTEIDDRYHVRYLQPYTTYKISVSAVTKAGEGEQSDPIINRTQEGAPDDGPHVDVIVVSNSTVSVAVQNPQAPNGEIRQFRFFVNNKRWENVTNKGEQEFVLTNLDSYTNYSVEVKACTVGDLCSPSSPVLLVKTEVGIPGPPAITKVQSYNTTHISIEWEDPEKPNGPIFGWIIHLAWKTDESQYMKQSFSISEDGSRIRILPLPVSCDDSNEIHPRIQPEYNISICAQSQLDGTESKQFVIQPCVLRGNEVLPLSVISIISVCSLLFMVLLSVLVCHGYRRLKEKLKEIQDIKVQLPKGLDSPNMSSFVSFVGDSKSALRGSLAHTPTHEIHTNRKFNGKDYRFSTSSIDELLYSLHGTSSEFENGITRMQSVESSGCSTGPESISSSMTAHTHLSVDSGADMDMPSSPTFDCAFMPPTEMIGNNNDLRIQNSYIERGFTNAPMSPMKNVLKSLHVNMPKKNNQDDLYDIDYLQPVASQPHFAVAHNKIATSVNPGDASDSSVSQSQNLSLPCVPPNLRQVSSKNRTTCDASHQSEPGYAKVGLSHSALQKECYNKQMEQFRKNQNDVDDVVFAVKPSMVKELTRQNMLVSPIASRTLQVPSVKNGLLLNKVENSTCSGDPSDHVLGTFPVSLTGPQKTPYITLDELRNSSVIQDVAKSLGELSESNDSAKVPSNFSNPKTYMSLSQLTTDPKHHVFPLPAPMSPVSLCDSSKGFQKPAHTVSNVELLGKNPSAYSNLQPLTRLKLCSKTYV